ncbi:prolactin regulatory element-binding protein [Agrilus planipennis]|uniref:Prolactin regulatory element-binding protein n=1 Tax=Agrilus planipennis TaxID=224129 RepID=A0A1W4WWP5_AGRPL|nr:prolactin regulatory element-binding protein [Agrilus planipennis]
MPSAARRRRDGLLARVNFPLYTVQMLTSRHVLVGGGGGSSKTGVANGFEIFELSHDGNKFIAEEVIRHETGSNVVMNCCTYSDKKHLHLVAGQESHCQLYKVQTKIHSNEVIEEIGDSSHEGLRQRKKSTQNNLDSNKNDRKLSFTLHPFDSVQTDFLEKEPLQRVVKINHTGSLIATGGTEGVVRIWQFPSLKLLHTLKAHSQEVDDVDFSPYENYLVSVAKDGFAILWDYNLGKEIGRLTWKHSDDVKYLYKRCRFGKVEDENVSTLFMITNPLHSSKQNSYLQKWIPSQQLLTRSVSFDESLSALAVRDDGRFVAVGTMFSGSVYIYIAFSLQKVLHIPGAHSMFITGLQFLPVTMDSHSISSTSEAAVLSISVDNQVCIHSLPYRKTIPLWFALIILFVMIILSFMFCAYLGI